MQDPSSLTKDQTHPPAAEVQCLNHWTTKVPIVYIFMIQRCFLSLLEFIFSFVTYALCVLVKDTKLTQRSYRYSIYSSSKCFQDSLFISRF